MDHFLKEDEMGAKKKLSLDALQIKSFVTSVGDIEAQFEGGRICGVTLCNPCTPGDCPTNDLPCFTKRTYCEPCDIVVHPI